MVTFNTIGTEVPEQDLGQSQSDLLVVVLPHVVNCVRRVSHSQSLFVTLGSLGCHDRVPLVKASRWIMVGCCWLMFCALLIERKAGLDMGGDD